MEYPYGPLLQLIALTGCRRSEIGEASRNEINLKEATLTVPPERFKSDATHVVPLVDDALAIIANLPRWNEHLQHTRRCASG
jgi:integrase